MVAENGKRDSVQQKKLVIRCFDCNRLSRVVLAGKQYMFNPESFVMSSISVAKELRGAEAYDTC